MPVDTILAEAPLAPSEVRALVDNATADRLYGWAWDAAHPGFRVTVELRLAGEVVATTVADRPRSDLAQHGVGDGCHAFEFPLQRQWFRQLRELSAVAYGKDGGPFLIPVHARREDEMLVPAQATARLQDTAEALIAQHQATRQELQELRTRSALLPEAAAVEAVAQAGREVQQRLDAMELWLTRLDARLAALAAPTGGTVRVRLDPWQVALVAILVGALCATATLVFLRHGG